MATSVTGQQPSRLFYVTDSVTGLRFLVDTGAEIMLSHPLLLAANTIRVVLVYRQLIAHQ